MTYFYFFRAALTASGALTSHREQIARVDAHDEAEARRLFETMPLALRYIGPNEKLVIGR